MKSVYNKIFVTIEKKFQDEITTESGLKLYLDTSYKPEDNSTTFGTVTHIPLQVDKTNVSKTFQHNVQVGDKLYFNYNIVMDPDNCVEIDGTEYWMVDYWNAIAVVRDERVIPVGDYILVDPIIEETIKSSLIVIPDHIAKKEKTRGIVWASNDPDVPVGSDVEYERVGKFWNVIEGKKLYCMFVSNIMYIYEKKRAKAN